MSQESDLSLHSSERIEKVKVCYTSDFIDTLNGWLK